MSKLMMRFTNLYKRINTFNIPVAYQMRQKIYHGITPQYISTLSKYLDKELKGIISKYADEPVPTTFRNTSDGTFHVWVCWWQGEEAMPEIIKLCYARLKAVTDDEKTQLHLITLDNYKQFVDIPEIFIDKFERGLITMTHLSDILRFLLLEKYGGYWVDSTVLFTGKIPDGYKNRIVYCQKMEHYPGYKFRSQEASGSRWCGFSIGGEKGNVLFRFLNDSLLWWWQNYDQLLDYVIVDYIILTGYKHIPAIKAIIDSIGDNNEDIFEMRKFINDEYSDELYEKLTARNVMHKITYKMELNKYTEDNKLTLYGYLFNETFGQSNPDEEL